MKVDMGPDGVKDIEIEVDDKGKTKIRRIKEDHSFAKTFFNIDFADAIMYGIKKELIPNFRHNLWEAICVVSKRILVPDEEEEDFDSYFRDAPSYRMNGGGSTDYSKRYKKKKKRSIKVDPIRFDTREEARDILEKMRSDVRKYGYIEVNDYLELCGFDSEKRYEDYGWDNLNDVRIRTIGNDYSINLPEATKI